MSSAAEADTTRLITRQPAQPTGQGARGPDGNGPSGPEEPPGEAEPFASRRLVTLAPLIVGAVAGALVGYQLFGGATIGMADNADSFRLACQLHLAAAPKGHTPLYWAYVILHWAPTTKAALLCPRWGTTLRYPSTEVPLLRAAGWISHLFGYRGIDLRALGVLGILFVGVLVGLICWIAPGKLWLRVVMSVFIAVVVADAAFAPYFISMYSAPAGLLGVLGLCAAWLWAPRHPVLRALSVIPIALAAFVLCLDETQLVPLVFVIGALLLWRRTNIPSRVGRLAAKALAVACIAMLIASFSWYIGKQSKVGNYPIQYDDVFMSLLPHSPHPAADLKWLGFSPKLAKYSGIDYWNNASAYAVSDPLYLKGFRKHFTYLRLSEFYLFHPSEAWGLFERSAGDAAELRPGPIGNYADNSGLAPQAHPCRFCSVSNVVPALKSIGWLVLPLWWLFALRTGWVLARRRKRELRWRALGETMIVLTLVAMASFGAVMIGEGDLDSTRHDVFASLATALLVPLAVAAIAGIMDTRRDEQGRWQPGRRLRRAIDFMVVPPVRHPDEGGLPGGHAVPPPTTRPGSQPQPRPETEPVGATRLQPLHDHSGP